MQVPDQMRQSVVFLYGRVKGSMVPAGTGFFLFSRVPGHGERTVAVLFTAHHVIDGIRTHSDDRKVHVRMNLRNGGARFFESSVDDWLHPDPGLDCAMLPWAPETGTPVEFGGWVLDDGVATSEVMRQQGIGIGDEVFMVGLFRNHIGQDRNEPILRVGNIAALPVDRIKTKLYGNMPAILIEARSLGGLSGSPVFVHFGGLRVRDGRPFTEASERPFFFLGCVHGHWDALDTEVDAPMLGRGEKLNIGIAIVVPAEQIIRAFGPLLDRYVEKAQAYLDAEQAPMQDSVASDESSTFDAQAIVQVPKSEIDELRAKE